MVKGNKVLSILATAVILAMLIAVIPATPVLAASISVTPTSGEIDDYVEIYCSGFDTEEDVYFYFSDEEADVGDEIGDEVENYERIALEYATHDASFEVDFDVPDKLTDGDSTVTVKSGDYYIYATYDDDEILDVDDFHVIATELSISPDEGTVNTSVKVEGSGFEGNEEIEIEFGGDSVDIEDGDEDTESDGDFTSYFLVPEHVAGDVTVTVTVGSDEAEAEFTVEPKITIDPEEGAANDRITITCTGFAYRDYVTITFDGEEAGGDETNGDGSVDIQINVPELGSGTYDIDAEDDEGNSASATFTISTEVSVSPTTSLNSPGYVGQDLTISGTGFKPDSEITITYASETKTYYTTSLADGSFSYTFEVPPSAAGAHTVTATDGVSSMSVTFVMESTPPKTPSPLQPYMDGKADSKAYFDWEDVTTDTDGINEKSLPITYQLQVATDQDFTGIVLDIKDIETSEYTLTEEEALESSSDETPHYYWRVRAVDAASNASPWTGAGIFKVGFIFNFPGLSGWGLYVLIGVGAVVLFFIGFWIGRRGGGDYY